VCKPQLLRTFKVFLYLRKTFLAFLKKKFLNVLNAFSEFGKFNVQYIHVVLMLQA